jgi:hypothetical protein
LDGNDTTGNWKHDATRTLSAKRKENLKTEPINVISPRAQKHETLSIEIPNLQRGMEPAPTDTASAEAELPKAVELPRFAPA